MSKDGALIKTEFYDLGNVKGIKCDLLIITDEVNQNKMGCIRLNSTYSSSYSTDTYIGNLDFDEIDACVKSLNYIVSNILPSNPTRYTEIEYTSRDGVKLGAYYEQNKLKWSAYVYTKDYTIRSAVFFDSSNITELKNILENAKSMISEITMK